MIPPVLIAVRAGKLLVPVPVILLWPLILLLLAIGALVLPFVRIPETGPAERAMLSFHIYRILGALRGLRVDVQSSRGDEVHVSCW